jgi:DNA-directed RNA polymerase specialized sigma24 family protein
MDSLTQTVLQLQNKSPNRREIISLLSPVIFKLMDYWKLFEPDIRSGFYCSLLGRLETVIAKYRYRENIQFMTWFQKVIRREYFKFYHQHKKQEIREKISIEKFYDQYQEDALQPQTPAQENSRLVSLLQRLSDKEKEVFLRKTGFYESRTADEPLSRRQIIFQILEQKTERYFIRLIKIQHEILQETDTLKKSVLKLKERQIHHRYQEIRNKLSRYKLTRTNKTVADQMKIGEGSVSTYMKRIRKKLKVSGSSFSSDSDPAG